MIWTASAYPSTSKGRGLDPPRPILFSALVNPERFWYTNPGAVFRYISMKLNRFHSALMTLALIASAATAADGLQSPRGKEVQQRSVSGYPDRHGFEFRAKAAQAPEKKVAGAEKRDLNKEGRQQIYAGKNAPTRPTFEVAPVK